MVTAFRYIHWVPVFPLIAFAINILFGRKVGHKAAWLSIFTSLCSCVIAFPAIFAVMQGDHYMTQVPWLKIGAYSLNFGILLDPFSATLLFVVTFIGTLIQIYASGYMHDDPRFSRFFAYVSLFMAAMLTLVISNNYLLFFMAWEVMGLCSYLLIGFWFEKDSASKASMKAFLTTRVGDVGFFLGILTLLVAGGSLQFMDLPSIVKASTHPSLLAAAALLIFCGTIGKSAQFPLHVWLPDAMEGPTPVSALIHAATMVAAGVYLIARSFPLFSAFPDVLHVVTIIGAITAFMAAFIGLTATDIKKVLAYSTISQLGFMVTAMGVGGLVPGTFHLMTHAFFKALLFLGAGSVIHGCGTQDLREMGGLLKKMPHTAATFIIASLAIAGVPPLAGFWSKDEILLTAFNSGHSFVFWLLLASAFMTAFYMFRLVFLAFFGKSRAKKDSHGHAHHVHESPAVMTGPLWVLAIGSIVVGLPGSPFMHHWFQTFLEPHGHGEIVLNWFVMRSSIAVGLGGILLAGIFYLGKGGFPEKIAKTFRPLYLASINKFWMDEIYAAVIIRPFNVLAEKLFGFDQKVVDGAVNGTGKATLWTSNVKNWIDKHIVDGLVNLTGGLTQFFSAVLRLAQTGFVQHYLLIVFVGLLVLIGLMSKS